MGKKERERAEGFFSRTGAQTCLSSCAVLDCQVCWVQLKADLRVSLWILSVPNVMKVIILARSNQHYSSVAPTSLEGFWSQSIGFLISYPSNHFGSPLSVLFLPMLLKSYPKHIWLYQCLDFLYLFLVVSYFQVLFKSLIHFGQIFILVSIGNLIHFSAYPVFQAL
jgi:hypothetical protein